MWVSFPSRLQIGNSLRDKCTGLRKHLPEMETRVGGRCRGRPGENVSGAVQVLNLFAYTGGATLAAGSAGASVTHVDSVKPVVSWARENMEASGLDGVRWIVDDALKFARREVKRGRKYSGIIPRSARLRTRTGRREVDSGGESQRIVAPVRRIARSGARFSGIEPLFDGVVGVAGPHGCPPIGR